MEAVRTNQTVFFDKYQKYNIPQVVDQIKVNGWGLLWESFHKLYDSYGNSQKAVFTDLFLGYCLRLLELPADNKLLWEIASRWHFYRKLPPRCGSLPHEQRQAALFFCLALKEKLTEYFLNTPQSEAVNLSEELQYNLVMLWRQIFLNAFSPLNIKPTDEKQRNQTANLFLSNSDKWVWYPNLIISSISAPFFTGDLHVNIAKLWRAPEIPPGFKTILVLWLTNVPYYNSDGQYREKILSSVSAFCQAAMQNPQYMSQGYFKIFVEEIMSGLWRAAYTGGNNLQALSSFGDFIHFFMKRFYPRFGALTFHRRPSGGKIRVGYISRNFCSQAVSCYMVNRVIHHDTENYEIFTFAVGERSDEMTQLFIKHSDKFIRFENLHDLSGMAQKIVDSKLDILIYTDIGMDPITYMLASLRLAPVQAALVGHGTTTGLPTIQYYLSGDFEPFNAHMHYREQLIKLPNLGAAQYIPEYSDSGISREKLGIPAEAVIFISCANGIKHAPARDRLLIEILRQVPDAWILLKPFQNPQSVNDQLIRRITAKARAAGVSKRLLFVPPLLKAKDVMNLLAITDVQLDTYPYGGWTTNMEALFMGLPMVTQQGEMMRNRWGAYMLRALGICEGIARDEPEYIAWAVRMGRDSKLRQRLREQILARVKETLFNGKAAQFAYEETLFTIVNENDMTRKTHGA